MKDEVLSINLNEYRARRFMAECVVQPKLIVEAVGVKIVYKIEKVYYEGEAVPFKEIR